MSKKKSKRRCKICGKILSESNTGNKCWHHNVDPEDVEPPYMSLCTSRFTSGFYRAQLEYHGNFGLGFNHIFER